MNGYAAESDDDETLLLNVVQSVEARYPLVPEPFACAIETVPFRYVSGPLKVVVLVHVGIPFKSARTCPAVPTDVVARAPDPLPKRTAPEAMLFHPVPPLLVPRIPVTSEARLTKVEETTPATAFSIPDADPKVKPVEIVKLVVEAVPETERLVVVAFERVVLPDTVSCVVDACVALN